ncbi:MAG: prealbumin-like fold domain-containing protein, partial [Clostridia bacterium]
MWHNCENAASGVQYVELNANMDGALYQDVLTVPGSTMYWSLAHRGRGTTSMRDGSDLAQDTMYVVVMSTVLAEQYDITTQSAVNDVIQNPSQYPGAQVVSITDDNWQWYYHDGQYEVPDSQYLTRYFFVAGETAFDRYSPGSGLAHTIGNHLDDIYFSMELPPPADGKVNLQINKTVVGLNADAARELMDQLVFKIGGTEVSGTELKNFTLSGANRFTATYQVQLDIGSGSSVTKTVEEVLSSAEYDGYERTATTVSVNGGTASNNNSVSVRIQNQGTGTVTFVNEYEPQTVSMEIQKTDENGDALSGAEFSLETLENHEWSFVERSLTVNNRGKAELSDLKYDVLYRLTETSAPDGYHLPKDAVYFKILMNNGTAVLQPCNEDGAARVDWPYLVSEISGTTLGIKITNEPGMSLPETGGIGRAALYPFGLFLLFSSMIFYGYTRKSKQEGRDGM